MYKRYRKLTKLVTLLLLLKIDTVE